MMGRVRRHSLSESHASTRGIGHINRTQYADNRDQGSSASKTSMVPLFGSSEGELCVSTPRLIKCRSAHPLLQPPEEAVMVVIHPGGDLRRELSPAIVLHPAAPGTSPPPPVPAGRMLHCEDDTDCEAADTDTLPVVCPGTEATCRRVLHSSTRSSRARTAVSRTQLPHQVDTVVHLLKEDSARRRLRRLSPDQKGEVRRARSAAPAEVHRRRREVMQQQLLEEQRREEQQQQRRAKARARFRWAQRMVRVLLHFLRVVIDISDQLTLRSAVEDQWATLNTSKEAKKLAFNPAVFSKNTVYARVPRWAKSILARKPEERKDTDCRKLHALLRGMRSWEKFTERIQMAMCRAFTYQYVDSRRVILRRGHVGQCFYFIYSGSVFVNVHDRTPTGEAFTKTVVVMSKGESFGELALLKDELRTATLTCRQGCELLSVDKEVFAKICPRIFETELDEKVTFLETVNIFQNKYWTREKLRELCFEGQIKEHKSNKVVVLDSAEDEWLYICMEGQCRIIKCLTLDTERSREEDGHDDDDLLTANVVQSKTTGAGGGGDKDVVVGELLTSVNKRHMLDHMDMDYVNRSKILELASQFDISAERLPDANTEPKEKTDERHAKTALEKEELDRLLLDGVVTLNTLLLTADGAGDIYLDIGLLRQCDVFDLYDIIYQTPATAGSSLILVSSGSKLLRVRKSNFRKCMDEDCLQNVKYLANQQQYPSDEVLLNSYRQKVEWDAYKHHVTCEVMQPHMGQARRRPLLTLIEKTQELKKRQDSRLLTTLSKNKTKGDELENAWRATQAACHLQELRDMEDKAEKDRQEAAMRRGKPRPQLHILPPGGTRHASNVVSRGQARCTTSDTKRS